MAKKVITKTSYKGSKFKPKGKKTTVDKIVDNTQFTAKQLHKQKMAQINKGFKTSTAQAAGKTARFASGAQAASEIAKANAQSDRDSLEMLEGLIDASANSNEETGSTGNGSNRTPRQEGSLDGIYN